MEKKIMRLKVNYHLDWDDRVSIAKIREDLDELEKLGATDINIDYEDYFGTIFIKFKPFKEAIETDEEYEERIKNEQKQREAKRLESYNEYLRLKKEFGK